MGKDNAKRLLDLVRRFKDGDTYNPTDVVLIEDAAREITALRKRVANSKEQAMRRHLMEACGMTKDKQVEDVEITKLQDCYYDDTVESKQWYTKAIEELKNSRYSDKYIDIVTRRNNVNGIYPPLAHTTPVIYHPNHPVYDLDKGHDPLVRIGDNVDPLMMGVPTTLLVE